MLKDFIVIGLWTLAMFFCILHKPQLIEFERSVWNSFKDIFIKKNVPTVPHESLEHRQARFNSGAEAGNELYAEGK